MLVPNESGFTLINDAIITCTSGQIQSIEPAQTQTFQPHTKPYLDSQVWLTHTYISRKRVYRICLGSFIALANESVFPEEARFADREYAQLVAKEFCDNLIEAGTTLHSSTVVHIHKQRMLYLKS